MPFFAYEKTNTGAYQPVIYQSKPTAKSVNGDSPMRLQEIELAADDKSTIDELVARYPLDAQ